MKRFLELFFRVATLMTLFTAATLAQTKYVITNDDTPSANSASIYSVGNAGALTLVTTIATGGSGLGGGDFSTARVNVLRSKTHNCAYVGDALGKNNGRPGDVAAIDMSSLTLAGTFPGFPLDSGNLFGVGLAENPSGTFLFAAYTQSGTITSYKQLAGCKLKRLSEIISVGALSGPVDGMKVTPNGKFLILAYGDGSIGSYKIDATTGALTLIGRYFVADSQAAAGLDITSDSQWALFGDGYFVPTVEVARIGSDGSLGPTKGYPGIGSGTSSDNVWLSPDESLLYISNTFSGQITAVPFDKTSGAVNVAKSCTSPVLKNFQSTWVYLGGVVSSGAKGTGSPLYAAEWSGKQTSGIAIVDVRKPCTLTETSASPALDSASDYLLSVGVDPPRSF
jgi:sugar lactone lactonase YvrE